VLAAAVLAAPAAVAVSTPSPAQADESPTIVLTAPDRVRTWEYENKVWTDFGLRVRVTGAALELWSQRPDYDSEVVLTQKLAGGDVTLPEGLTDQVGRLSDFIRLTFNRTDLPDNADAPPPFHRRIDGCLSSVARLSPDATFRSDYPRGCWYNPFAIGSVQGIPAGWTGSVVEEYSEAGIRVRPGRYEVTARIAAPYADALGIARADRAATTTLVVLDSEEEECRGGCRQPHGGGLADPTTPLQPEAREPKGPGVGSLAELPEGTPVPDLRSLPAFGIELNRKGTQLRFAANVWNNGTSDLVVDGFRRADEDVMDAYQYFLDDDGEVVAYEPVGEMEWDPDPTHRHWHFTDFATYRLLAEDKTTEVVSGKEAFCLANTDAVDLTAAGANWTVSYDDLGSVCGGLESQAIREVLAAGWGDTYAQFRAGQAFPIANVPDGVYYVQVLANPEQNLIEADTTNNESLRRIRLSTTDSGKRKVWVAPVGIVDESVGMFG
jgi:hypothetical protein